MANEVEMTALSETEKDCEMQFAGTSPQIIVEGTKEKPYYNIMYRDISDGIVHVGFGSYDLENVFGWLKEYFGEDRAKIVDPDNFRPTGRWAHLFGDEWCCTNCGFVISTEGSWEKPEKKFCEECGAKMMEG